jgi:peptidoglycan hydrolase-like protein with peptidoglycan-binding domain
MTRLMRPMFLVMAASAFASVSLASAQGVSDAATTKTGIPVGSGTETSQRASKASGGERNSQGRTAGSPEVGRTDGSAWESDSGRAQREELRKRDRAPAKGWSDAGEGQTIEKGQSDRDERRRSEGRTPDQGKSHSRQVRQHSRKNKSVSNIQGQSEERNSDSETGETQSLTNLTAQQQATLQQSVLYAANAPRANVNSINFQVHSGVAVPPNVSVASVSTYPALIDVFPDYRGYSFFVVEDDLVFVDRDRRIVDIVPTGPRTRFSDGGHGSSGRVIPTDMSHDDIRVVQRVLIERGLLHGEADGVVGPKTHAALRAFQRQQGVEVTGSIDAPTISSLGVSGRLTNQSIGQSQSSPTGVQTPKTDQGQIKTGQAHTVQPQPSHQDATVQAPNQATDQLTSPPAKQSQSSTTGLSTASKKQSYTAGPAAPQTQSGNKQGANKNISSDAFSLTLTTAAVGVLLLALGAFIIVPAV